MNSNDKADAAWDDYVSQQQEEKIEQLERELNAANERIKRLEAALSELLMWLGEDISDSNRQLLEDHCRKAKEAKP